MDTEKYFRYALESQTTDQWFDTESCVNRLLEEWNKHNRLIVAYDFDGTVNGNDLGTKGVECTKMIELLQRCKRNGCILIVFTAREEKDYTKIANWLTDNNIPFDYINENVPDMKKDETSKIFYNIFFDDRTGMGQAYEIMSKVLDIKESQITNESYLISKEDTVYNMDKYKNGQNNVCFIIGHSGSGKSTLANDLFIQDDGTVSLLCLDNIIWNECLSLEEWKDHGEVPYLFFRGPGKKYFHLSDEEIGKRYKGMDAVSYPYEGTFEYSVIQDFIKFTLDYAAKHPNEHFIIEGLWTFLFMRPEDIDKYTVIIKGTSFFTSYFRAFKRDWKNEDTKKGISKIKWQIKRIPWLAHDIGWERILENFRKHFS